MVMFSHQGGNFIEFNFCFSFLFLICIGATSPTDLSKISKISLKKGIDNRIVTTS